MKKISMYASIAVLFTVLFSSCKKNEEYNYDANGGQKIVHFIAKGGYDTYFGNSNIAADPADSAQIIEMRSESINNNLFLNIYTTEDNGNLDASGYYNFTVL